MLSLPTGACLHGFLPAPACPLGSASTVLLACVLGRKFPSIEDQSDSPSVRLLEKKKEAKIMHHAMEQKKEVGSLG